jgi:hypothetical protein
MKTELVEDKRVLKALNKANLIVWPCLINNSKKIPFLYCESVNDKYSFEHKGIKYQLKYHSGCFMPYVYKVIQPS